MIGKIGVGIIGTGFARRTQIPAFCTVKEAAVTSASSGRAENAEAVAAEFGIGHFSGDWRETVLHEDVDLVCITTPPNLHLEMTQFALKHGKHVLCEKPMAMNADEAVLMLKAARESGCLTLIDHELRFTNGRSKAFQLIRDGKIGKIRHAKYLFQNASRGDAGVPWTWWSDIEQGGGALGAIGSHVIDTLRWFTDAEIEKVFCRLHSHVKKRPFEGGTREVTSDDETLMTLELGESGLVEDATASVSISLVEAGPYRNRVEFFGTKGAIRIEDSGELFFADISARDWVPFELDLGPVADGMPAGGWSRGFLVFAQKIIDALAKDETSVSGAATFEDGLAIQKVLDAARRSHATGSMIVV